MIIFIYFKIPKEDNSDNNNFEEKISEFKDLINKKNEQYLESEKIKEGHLISIKNELKILSDILNGKIQSLPVLNAQLNAVIEQTNNSVNELILDFLNIDKKVKEQNSNTRNLLNNLGFKDLKKFTLLDNNKLVFNNLINNITEITKIIQKIFDEFIKIINNFNKLNNITDSIKEFSGKTKLLSFNAMVESARAGESGKGFKIVAQEVRSLSDKISSFVNEEEKLIENLLGQSNNQVDLFNKEFNKINDITKDSKNRIEYCLNEIDGVISNLKSQLDNFQITGDYFSNEINRIIVSFQFQDIIRQRLEHVIEPLDSIYMEINNKLNLITDINNRIKSIEEESSQRTSEFSNLLTDWLKNFYTIKDEKELLNKHLFNIKQHEEN